MIKNASETFLQRSAGHRSWNCAEGKQTCPDNQRELVHVR
jgi:hypothetical protein